METNEDTWQLARFILERHGQQASYGIRSVCAALRDQDNGVSSASSLDIVRAIDFILSEDEFGTIH